MQGFPRPRVLRALVATQSEHLQAALDWILAAGDEPGTDDPFTGPEPSAVSRQELQQLRQLQERASGHYQQQQQQQQQSLPPPLLHSPSPSAGWSLGSMGASSGGGAAFVTDVIPMSGGYASSGGGAAAAAVGHRGSGGGVIGVAGIMHREAAKTSQTSASLAVAFQVSLLAFW